METSGEIVITTVVRADFKDLFGNLLCLSHGDSCTDADGSPVHLAEGQLIIAFEDESLEKRREYLIASGSVERAPEEVACPGSRWVLRLDAQGVRRVAELPTAEV